MESLDFESPRFESPCVESLFFALRPDAAARAEIADLARTLWSTHGLQGRRIQPERYHVTLHYLGQSAGRRTDVEATAMACADRVLAKAVAVGLASACSFRGGGDKPCVLRVAEPATALHALWRELGRALGEGGLAMPLEREFTPHVTIGYDREGLPLLDVPAVNWVADEFELMRSVRGQPRHDIVGRFRLQPGS